MLVSGLILVAFLFRLSLIEGKCYVGVLSFFLDKGFFMLKGRSCWDSCDRELICLKYELFVWLNADIIFSCDFLIGQELQRQGRDEITSNVESLKALFFLTEEVIDHFSHSWVSERTELPLLVAGESRQDVGHGSWGYDSGPKRHVGLGESIDDLKPLLSLVDQCEV